MRGECAWVVAAPPWACQSDAVNDDRLEVAHVAAEAVASYAPAEDAAVVVEAGDAALAGGAVVRRLAHVLDVVAALAARVDS